MSEYINILLTQNGVFCTAPAWEVKDGDFVYLRDAVSGENKMFEVISVVTDSADGEFVGMIEKYIGYPLPRINARFKKHEVKWNEPVQE